MAQVFDCETYPQPRRHVETRDICPTRIALRYDLKTPITGSVDP